MIRQPDREEFIEVINTILMTTFPESERPDAAGILQMYDDGVINPLVAFEDGKPMGTAVGIWSRKGNLSFDDVSTHAVLKEFAQLEEFAAPQEVDDPEAVSVAHPDGDEVTLADIPDVILLNWLAVAQEGRGGGYGGRLLREAVAMWEEKFNPLLIIAEVEDPDVHDGSLETGDPSARMRFYKRHGARVIDTPFIIPRRWAEDDLLHGMIPLAIGGRALDSEPFGDQLADFLAEYVEYSGEIRGADGRYIEPLIQQMLDEAPNAKLAD